MTDSDDDLYKKMAFQKSHFFLLQIIEWPINTATYAMAMSALNFLRPMHWMRPLFRVVKNVTFEVTSFRVNQRQTRLISGLLKQV